MGVIYTASIREIAKTQFRGFSGDGEARFISACIRTCKHGCLVPSIGVAAPRILRASTGEERSKFPPCKHVFSFRTRFCESETFLLTAIVIILIIKVFPGITFDFVLLGARSGRIGKVRGAWVEQSIVDSKKFGTF